VVQKGERSVIDNNVVVMSVLVVVLAVFAWWRGGAPLVEEGLRGGLALAIRFALLIALAFLAAGLAEKLVPGEWIRGALGEESGLRGILLASAAGALTPAGPYLSMPLAAAMHRSGASTGAVVAFLSGWSLLAIQRLVAWELPLLGPRIALIRYGVCLLLPVVAGLIARALTRS
jgi:uncharacterized membrane protein YraQ (UPF0718 family)